MNKVNVDLSDWNLDFPDLKHVASSVIETYLSSLGRTDAYISTDDKGDITFFMSTDNNDPKASGFCVSDTFYDVFADAIESVADYNNKDIKPKQFEQRSKDIAVLKNIKLNLESVLLDINKALDGAS